MPLRDFNLLSDVLELVANHKLDQAEAKRLIELNIERAILEAKTPITNPTEEHGCFVFKTTWEDQARIADWNWRCIYLMAKELEKLREE